MKLIGWIIGLGSDLMITSNPETVFQKGFFARFWQVVLRVN
jgi:hypothetical protein